MLEERNLFIREGICLGNDRNEIDFGVKSAHDLDIERLERVTGGLYEVDTSMHTVVDDVHAIELVLRIEESIETLLNVLNDWSPRVVVVHKVTEPRSVHNGQSQTDSILFNVCTDGLDGHRLRGKVETWLFAFLGRI